MTPPRLATLLSGQDRQFIDHLAPISQILNIPMVINDEEMESLIQNYYPKVKVIYKNSLDLGFYLTKNFEIIYTCLPNPLFREIVFAAELTCKKTLFNVWCPHGNSDKGYREKYMESLSQESFALVYGQKMMDFLSEKGSFQQLKGVIKTGNYRLKYYNQNKEFYQKKLKELICCSGNKTIVYAPTWKDAEHSSSFEGAIQQILKTLPNHLNLLIKPHPNLFSSPDLFELFLYQFPSKKNVFILSDFPPVYPVLDLADIYLGDMSSVGYDFLSFKKPMFFLNTNKRNPKEDKGLYLTQCGTLIEPEDYENIFSIIENTNPSPFEKIQNTVYDQAFGEQEDFKEKIMNVYETFNSE
ncbi:MAG: CDP-glycerol glycerophosphotransferase family protein [Simkaniaceae bacterium]|nr:CDP-glycerol glycerophosphotransferase family protein [Simkaniaceae bacterium]